MDRRLQLQALLEELLGSDQVHFQPTSNLEMVYPAIVYERDFASIVRADNALYRHMKRYQVTIIDRDPDSPFPDKVAALPMCTFVRHFKADNLNHDIYSLYY
jgi:hypothetical protein